VTRLYNGTESHSGGAIISNMIDMDTMEILSEKLLGEIDKHIWQRGYSYYLEGAVEDVSVTDTAVTASVQGNTRYSVSMEFRSFRIRLSCSCPYERCCKHMAAVFLQVYESLGDPSEFMNFRVFGDEPDMPIERLQQQPVLKKSILTADDGLTAWAAHVEATYASISRRLYQYGHPYDLHSEFILPFYHVSRSWPAAKSQLYRLYVLCFLIDRVFGEMSENEHSNRYDRQSFRSDIAARLLQDCFGTLRRLFGEAAHSELAQTWISEGTFWDISAYLRSCFLKSKHVNVATVLAYQLLWMQVAYLGGGTSNEIEQLRGAFREVQDGSPVAESLQMAIVCLLVLESRDDEALAMADVFTEETEESFALTVTYIAESEDWPRLVKWLRFVTARMNLLGADNLRRFANLWLTIRQHLSVDDECETFLRKGLPGTRNYYQQFIFESNQMRKWVELQLLNQNDPIEYRADFLKQIETSDREALLPWYHQAIERAVRRKNRDSYKVAARMLKKLSSHYKKLKRTGEWDRFMDRFLTRHARLRALHEEMRKKGLIS
jgi:hypothetical protein